LRTSQQQKQQAKTYSNSKKQGQGSIQVSYHRQSIVKPVETTEIPVAYQQHIQEKPDIHMAEITKCKLSKKHEVGNPMLCQGKHATKNPGKKHHIGGKIGENLPWPEALWRR